MNIYTTLDECDIETIANEAIGQTATEAARSATGSLRA